MIELRRAAELGTALNDIDEIKAFSAVMMDYLPHYLGIDAQLPTTTVMLIFGFEDYPVDEAEIEYGVELAESYGS